MAQKANEEEEEEENKHCCPQDLRVFVMTSQMQTMRITFSFTTYIQQMHNIVHLLVICCQYMQNAQYTRFQECLSRITLQFDSQTTRLIINKY